MNLEPCKPGRRVQCNVRGRIFEAEVLERTAEGLRIAPPRGISYHHVSARQVRKVLKG
jgi:hypothetical protein